MASDLETKWKMWSPLETNRTFGLKGISLFEKDLMISKDRKIFWSENKFGDQMFRFQNAINSETEM